MASSDDPWISVQLPDELKRYLEIQSGLEGVSRSEFLRRLIQHDADLPENRKIRKLARERSTTSA